ncbi:glutamate-5-semialdehyde dehydrogenase [bacterium]|nr:glutamate-5-semialdehyde dehydrogenase [bacterium]
MELKELLEKAKKAKYDMAKSTNDLRNKALKNIALKLEEMRDFILETNKIDILNAHKSNYEASFIERLTLTENRIDMLVDSVYKIISLEDYNGKIVEKIQRPNGLIIEKVLVPFGTLLTIFESRPNVTVDISIMSIKTGNTVILKGGKEAINTNRCLSSIMREAIKEYINPDSILFIDSIDRNITEELLKSNEYIDLLIPRGSKNLIDYCVKNSKVPFIETGAGNCHLYIHEDADLDMALKIAINAKYSRPSVCNAIETILVDKKIAENALKLIYNSFSNLNIEMRGCDETLKYININKATEEDYYKEYNDYIIAIKVVEDYHEAINHISKYSTKHSETIVTENKNIAAIFLNEIDSACIYHNASTRFTDGGCFGFGAEIGISTSKLHARGPMGLKEIMTYKYKIYGNGEVR